MAFHLSTIWERSVTVIKRSHQINMTLYDTLNVLYNKISFTSNYDVSGFIFVKSLFS